MRFQKNELLRQNRRNPQLERAARLRRLVVPLNEVEAEWREHGGKQHLERIGHHYNLFADLYPSPFQPRGFLRVVYRESAAEVHTGNILTASQTVSRPDVYLPPDLPPGAYSSLVFTNPDGHLCSGEKEVLHWMIVNMQQEGGLSSGTEVAPYLPPLPLRGTGFHRCVFSLYTHPQPLELSSLPRVSADSQETWLQHRTFSSPSFSAALPQLQPHTFAFFQCQWDLSVHQAFMHTLVYPEPVYGFEKRVTRRRERRSQIREKRTLRYSNM